MDKIWRLKSCYECPAFFVVGEFTAVPQNMCDLEFKAIPDLSNTDFPDWCPLEDIN